MRLTELRFASLLSYSPYDKLPEHERSKEIRTFLKKDEHVVKPGSDNLTVPMSEWIALTMEARKNSLPFLDFFQTNMVLVPTPKSSLMQANTLWVPEHLANELVKKGFGSKVIPYLERIKALPKSAFSLPADRPKVTPHLESLAVDGSLEPPEQILLVDDIITRGATLMGAANRLLEVFPAAQIRAFAAMRTISDSNEFRNIYSPCVGNVHYRPDYDDTLRRP